MRQLIAISLITISTSVYAQDDPEALADQTRRHDQHMANVNAIVRDKVAATFGDLGASGTPGIDANDIDTLLAAVLEAEILHSELSPGETGYGQPAPDAVKDTWECRPVTRVYKRHYCGGYSVFYRTTMEWVRVQKPKRQYGTSVQKRPLREAIVALKNYFGGRDRQSKGLSGGIPPNAERDRVAALQLLAVLVNLDPNYDVGSLRGR